jgi:hypothetical protein
MIDLLLCHNHKQKTNLTLIYDQSQACIHLSLGDLPTHLPISTKTILFSTGKYTTPDAIIV